MMHHILLIRNAVLGASASLPFFEGTNHGLDQSPSLENVEHPIARPISAPGWSTRNYPFQDSAIASHFLDLLIVTS